MASDPPPTTSVVIRVDAARRIGSGHVMRCLALAGALRDQGIHVRFVSRAHQGHLIGRVSSDGFDTVVLARPARERKGDKERYGDWVGTSQEQDAKETIDGMTGPTPDWLIVDHYGLDADWERLLRPHVGGILAIDDLANRPHDCDILLDQNYVGTSNARYRGLVSAECRLLLGPRYALLRPEFRAFRERSRAHRPGVRRVFVFLGGTDQEGMTILALKALSGSRFRKLTVDVLLGPNNAHTDKIEELALRRGLTAVLSPRSRLAELMSNADVAIGAGGTTTWERMCLGLPSIVVSVAENQRAGCEALARDGLIEYVGHVDQIRATDIHEALTHLTTDPDRLSDLRMKSRQLVDGCGALRVARELTA